MSEKINYSYKQPKSYEIDFDKIKTINDCVLLLRGICCNKAIIFEDSPMFEEMKYLAKDVEDENL